MIVGTTSSPLGFRSPTLMGMTGLFFRLAGGRRGLLREGQGVVPPLSRPNLRSTARRGVPASEYQRLNCGQVAAGRVFEDLEPILDRGGIAIVAVEVEVQRTLA
jgi:hypothetical protein